MGQMLTAKQVAEVKGCSYQYVQRIIKEGKLQAQEILNDKNRKTYLVPLEALDEELQQNGLIRAAAYKKRIEVQNRDNYEAGLEAVKSLVFEAMAKENPELYRQVSAYLNKKKNEGLEG